MLPAEDDRAAVRRVNAVDPQPSTAPGARTRMGSHSGIRLREEVGVPGRASTPYLIGSREQEVLDTFRAHRAEALGIRNGRRSSDPGALIERAATPLAADRISSIPAKAPRVSRLSLPVVLAAGVVGALVLVFGYMGLRFIVGGLLDKEHPPSAQRTTTRIPQ